MSGDRVLWPRYYIARPSNSTTWKLESAYDKTTNRQKNMKCYFSSKSFKKCWVWSYFRTCVAKNLASFKIYSDAIILKFITKKKLPNTCKTTNILLLRKSNIGNYLPFGAYYPISFLPILSKVLEYLVIQKIAHLYNNNNLLSGNLIDGLKCRNTLDTITT